MTFILICFASELFTLLLSSAILLTPESSKVNELSLSNVLWSIQEGGFLAELGICCSKATPEPVLTYRERVPHSRSRCY